MAIRRYWQDEPGGGVTLVTEQDVESIIEVATESAKVQPKHWHGDGFHKVASIPIPLLLDLQAAGITNDPVAFGKVLNDPALRKFRTKLGKV